MSNYFQDWTHSKQVSIATMTTEISPFSEEVHKLLAGRLTMFHISIQHIEPIVFLPLQNNNIASFKHVKLGSNKQ